MEGDRQEACTGQSQAEQEAWCWSKSQSSRQRKLQRAFSFSLMSHSHPICNSYPPGSIDIEHELHSSGSAQVLNGLGASLSGK